MESMVIGWSFFIFGAAVVPLILGARNTYVGVTLLVNPKTSLYRAKKQWLRDRPNVVRCIGIYAIVGCGVPFVVAGLLGIITFTLKLFGIHV